MYGLESLQGDVGPHFTALALARDERWLGVMKSAYELAMDRLSASEGAAPKLTVAQKKQLAELDQRHKAGVAELEITLAPQISAARAARDADAIALLEKELRTGKARLADELEVKKEKVRAAKK